MDLQNGLNGLLNSVEIQNEKEEEMNGEAKRISVFDTYKQARLKKAEDLLKLIEENNELEDQRTTALTLIEPKKKFTFLQRLFTKRVQYREYTE